MRRYNSILLNLRKRLVLPLLLAGVLASSGAEAIFSSNAMQYLSKLRDDLERSKTNASAVTVTNPPVVESAVKATPPAATNGTVVKPVTVAPNPAVNSNIQSPPVPANPPPPSVPVPIVENTQPKVVVPPPPAPVVPTPPAVPVAAVTTVPPAPVILANARVELMTNVVITTNMVQTLIPQVVSNWGIATHAYLVTNAAIKTNVVISTNAVVNRYAVVSTNELVSKVAAIGTNMVTTTRGVLATNVVVSTNIVIGTNAVINTHTLTLTNIVVSPLPIVSSNTTIETNVVIQATTTPDGQNIWTTNIVIGPNTVYFTNMGLVTNVLFIPTSYQTTNIIWVTNSVSSTNAVIVTNWFSITNPVVVTNQYFLTNPVVVTNVLATTNILVATNAVISTNIIVGTNVVTSTNLIVATNMAATLTPVVQTNVLVTTNIITSSTTTPVLAPASVTNTASPGGIEFVASTSRPPATLIAPAKEPNEPPANAVQPLPDRAVTKDSTGVFATNANGLVFSNNVLMTADMPEAPLVYAGCNSTVRTEWQKRFVLGPNDVINVSLYGRPEYFRPSVLIGPDGRLTYLQAKGVVAAGLTIDELREKLNQELGEFYTKPSIVITPGEFRSKRYHILGKVVNKGTFVLDRPKTLIEAVAEAGGLETGLFHLNTVELADLPRSFVIRKGKRLPVNLKKLFQEGDVSQNILLEPEDYIYFPSSQQNEVYVLGSVMSPGFQGLSLDATVMSTISLAGGFTPKAYKQRVLVVRGSLTKPERFIVDTKAILAGKTKDFILEARDIVYVSDRPWARVEELADIAISSFIEAMVTSWVNANMGPYITSPILPQVKVNNP